MGNVKPQNTYKDMKHFILILLTALCCTCCNAQKDKEATTMKTTERFDVQYYKNIIKEKIPMRMPHLLNMLREMALRSMCHLTRMDISYKKLSHLLMR